MISGEHFLRIRQENDIIEFDCPEAESGFWQRYFDLDTDYGAVIRGIPEKDRYLTEAARAGQGIRILRQDAWEMILSFIISQQKTIPMIQAAVEALSKAYGTRRTAADGQVYHSFPRPEQLSGVSLEDLSLIHISATISAERCTDSPPMRIPLEVKPEFPNGDCPPVPTQRLPPSCLESCSLIRSSRSFKISSSDMPV